MAMQVRVLRDFAAKDGMIVHAGGVLGFEDDADAYELIHAGHAEPPVRLRSAIDGLIGRHNVGVGDLVDMPGDGPWSDGGDPRVEPLAAVVAGEPTGRGFDGVLNFAAAAGELVAVPPRLALQLIAAGGRYATKEEAAPLDLGGRDRFPKPAPAEPTGPTTKLFFLNGATLPDGRRVAGGSIVEVADSDVDLVLRSFDLVERCVKARVLRDNVIVGGRYIHAAGDVVDVPKSIADDGDRFEAIGPAEKAAGRVVDVLGMVGKAAGKRTVAAPGPGDAR